MLVSTATANKLIADVWFARGDFARDHPDICEGLVRGIFDGMEKMKTDAGKKSAAAEMAKLYSIPEADTLGMLGDAHSTNYAENREFFMNQNNPANFERTWNTAYLLYRKMNRISQAVPFDKVMDFSILQKLENEEPYKSSRNEYQINFAPKTVQSIKAEGSEILTKVVTLHFYPNSWDLRKTITVRENGKDIEKPYEPGVDAVLEEVGKLAAQYGAANIVVEGHTDALDERPGEPADGQGTLRQPRRRREDGNPQEIPELQRQPVLHRRCRLGPPVRRERSQQPRAQPPRGDQGHRA